MACVAERDAAVREVAEVYEFIKLQQPLLLLHHSSTTTHLQLAQSLLGKALRALNVALSVIKQQQQPVVVVKAEPHQLLPPSPASADSQAVVAPSSTATRGAKRRRSAAAMEGKKKTSSTWTMETAAPYDDGYVWRKYGEKKINGTLFTRSYFRCTYKDDSSGCLATKHVQQMDNGGSDQPMYQVTYNNHHTCKADTGSSSSSSNLAALLAGMKQEPTGHAAAVAAATAMNMKQEPPLLPALVDLQPSACFRYEQITQSFQQEPLFHNSPVDGGIPSAAGSCISGETSWWDGCSGDMAAAAEDDPLHDLERFLFMDY